MNDTTIVLTIAAEPAPTTDFIVSLGTTLLKEKRQTWMDMTEAAAFCKAQGILLNGKRLGADDLEAALKAQLPTSGEYYADGLAIDGYERRVGWDLVFMIRVYPRHAQP